MNKLLSSLGVALVAATMSLLAGCNLYFGDKGSSPGNGGGNGTGVGNGTGNGNGTGTGTGSTGTGTPGGGDNGSGLPPGFSCTMDTNCAAGCFCANGVCTEGGFCGTDQDCGTDFHCDTNRSSCIPTSSIGGCQGDILDSCTVKAPACAENQVPLRKSGCYTGACAAISACEAPPECKAIQHEDDCNARTADCTAVSNGSDCKHTDGTACHTGDTGCTCASYVYVGCQDQTAGAGPIQILMQ